MYILYILYLSKYLKDILRRVFTIWSLRSIILRRIFPILSLRSVISRRVFTILSVRSVILRRVFVLERFRPPRHGKLIPRGQNGLQDPSGRSKIASRWPQGRPRVAPDAPEPAPDAPQRGLERAARGIAVIVNISELHEAFRRSEASKA